MRALHDIVRLKSSLLGFFFILVALFVGCEQAKVNQDEMRAMPVERTVDVGAQSQVFHQERLNLKVNVGQMIYRGEGEFERIVFEEGVNIYAETASKVELLKLKANAGLIVYPFDVVTLRNVLIETEDGTEFEAKRLDWFSKEQELPLLLHGDVRIVAKNAILEGDSLVANSLFTAYRLDIVRGMTGLE